MKFQELTELIDKKIENNPEKVVLSFFEIEVKFNLSKREQRAVLDYAKTRFINMGYDVFWEGEEYFYIDKLYKVLPQEKLVAIKIKKS